MAKTYYSPFFPLPEDGGAKGSTVPIITPGTVVDIIDNIDDINNTIGGLQPIDNDAPVLVSGLALSSTVSLDTDGSQVITLKAVWTASTASDLNHYDLAIQENGGGFVEFQSGPTSTQYTWSVIGNQSFGAKIRAVDHAGNLGPYSAVVTVTSAKDTIPPAAPTALVANAGFNVVFLQWLNPNDQDLATVEIYENTTNNSATASRIAVVNGAYGKQGGYARTAISTASTRYYWLKAVDSSGNASSFSTGVNATTVAVNQGDFATGLEPTGSGTALPNPTGYTGPKLFYNTTDKKLYRYDASGPSWTAAVPTADLTGLLSGTQLADAAISVAKFATGLRPVELLSSLPTTGNVQGRTVLLTTDNKLYRYTGTAWTAAVESVDINGQLLEAQLADNAVTVAKIAAGAVQASKIADGAVIAAKIQDAAITNAKLVSGLAAIESVATLPNSGNYQGRTIMLQSDGKLYRWNSTATTGTANWTSAVPTVDLSGTIVSAQIADNAVTVAKIVDGAIAEAKLAANAVTAGKIADLAITAAKVADNAISVNKIVDGAIAEAKLASGAVTSVKIADASISNIKLSDGLAAIESVAALPSTANFRGRTVMLQSDGKLYRWNSTTTTGTVSWTAAVPTVDLSGTITEAQVANLAITAAKVADNAITVNKILDGAIIGDKLASSAVTSAKLADNAVTVAKIVDGAVSSIKIVDNAITAAKIVDNAITNAKLVNGLAAIESVAALPSTANFQGRTVMLQSDGKIYRWNSTATTGTASWTSAVPTADLSGTVVATQIADGAVIATKIADAAITNAKLVNGLAAIESVSALPSSGNYQGRTIMLQSDGKLYRWNSTATTGTVNWTSAVPTSDLSGTVVSAQIADNAVTVTKIVDGAIQAAKLADSAVTNAKIADAVIDNSKLISGLSAIESVSALPSTGNYRGRTVMLQSDGKLYRWNSTTTTGTASWTAAVPTADLSGTVLSAQIADNAITVAKIVDGAISEGKIAAGAVTNTKIGDATINNAKLVSGLAAIESVAALPNSGNYQGRTVMLQSDGKLYRWNSTATTGTTNWTSAVPTTDLSGTVVSAQIADNAVTVAKIVDNAITNAKIAAGAVTATEIADAALTAVKFASGVRPVEVLATLPTTGNVVGRTVMLTTDYKLYRYNGTAFVASVPAADVTGQITSTQITDNAITTAKVAANAITATEIASNAVTADKIIANAITAGKIAAGAVTATTIAANSITASKLFVGDVTNFCQDPMFSDSVYWSSYVPNTTDTTPLAAMGVTAAYKSPVGNGTNSQADNSVSMPSAQNFTVEGGARYRLNFAYYITSGFTGLLGLRVYWFKADGTAASSSTSTLYSNDYRTAAATAILSSSATSIVTAPTDALYARLQVRTFWSTTLNNANYGYLAYPIMNRATSAELIVDGAITANAIATNAITAGKIAANAVTAATIAAGAVTAGKVAADAITATNIVAGTITSTEIASSAITADKIATNAVTADKIIVNAITAGKIAANAVTASTIAANSITASKLLVADITNLLLDPNFTDTAYWLSNSATTEFNSTDTTQLTALNAKTAYKVSASGAANQAETNMRPLLAQSPPVEGDGKYRCRFNYLVTAGFNGYLAIRITWIDATDTTISNGTVAAVDFRTTPASAQTLGVLEAITTAPSNAVKAYFNIRNLWPSTASVGNSYVTFPLMQRAINSELLVDGAVVANSIAAGAITAGKIAANAVTATTIAAGAVTAGKVAANAITATEIASNAITAVKIATGAITAGKVAANAITSNEIAANTITAANIASSTITGDLIAANAISAKQLVIADFSNLFPNGSFADNTTNGWQANGSLSVVARSSLSWLSDLPSEYVGRAISSSSSPTFNTETFPVVPGETYYMEYWITGPAATAGLTATAYVRRYGVADSAGSPTTIGSGILLDKVATKISGTWTIPSDIVRINAGVRINNTTGGEITAFFTGFVLRRIASGNLIVDGAITAGKVAANAITATNIVAGTITSTEIATGAITAGKVAANAITATNIVAGTITSTEIAANAITATQLAANAVTANKVQAGAISTAALAAGAVTASKVFIGDTSNMVPDPGFNDTASWTGSPYTLTSTSSVFSSDYYLRILATAGDTAYVASAPIPVEKGATYYAGGIPFTSAAGSATSTLFVNWYSDVAGNTQISFDTIAVSTSTAQTTMGLIVTAPATARRARFVVGRTPGTTNAGEARLANPIFRKASSGELIVDGAITADKVAANAITAGKVAANAITAVNIVSGSITANEIAAGTITGNKLVAGTITGSLIAASSITATKLLIGDTSNIFGDPLMADPAYYALGTYTLVATSYGYASTSRAQSALNTTQQDMYSLTFPVEPNKPYFISSVGFVESGTTTAQFYINWFNGPDGSGTTTSPLVGSTTSTSPANRISGILVSPTDARSARLGWRKASSAANARVSFAEPVVRRAANGELIVDGSITTAKLVANAVTANEIAAGTITATEIATGAITAGKIAANAVTATNIVAGTITANEIASNAITAAKIAAGAIIAGKIGANVITATEIAAGTITAAEIASNAITAVKIAANAVTATAILAGAVTAGKIAANAVTANEIAAGTIVAANIAAGAITASKLTIGDTSNMIPDPNMVDLSSWNGPTLVTSPAAGTWLSQNYLQAASSASAIDFGTNMINVEAGKQYYVSGKSRGTASGITTYIYINWYSGYTFDTFINSDIVLTNTGGTGWNVGSGIFTAPATARAASVRWVKGSGTSGVHGIDPIFKRATSGELIVDGAITATKVAANSISATHIVAGTISATEIAAGAITTAKIATNAVTATQIAAGTITATEIASNAITAVKIAAGAIVAGKIAAGAIVANDIAASTITGAKIAADTITATNILAGTITATEIASNAITAVKIASNAITSDKILANAITAAKIAAGTITSNEIAARTIVASKLFIGDTSNMVPDPNMADLASWTSNVTLTSGGAVGTYTSTNYLYTTPSTDAHDFGCVPIRIEAGKDYFISSGIRPSVNGVVTALYVNWYSNNGDGSDFISNNLIGTSNSTAGFEPRQYGIFTAPANARVASIRFTKASGATSSGVQGIDPIFRRAASGELIVDGAITATKIAANSVTATHIVAGTITATQIAGSTITAAKIASGTITATQIASNAITAVKIAAGAVSAGKIAANAVTSVEIAANTITAGNIAAGAITATEIAANAITAKQLVLTDFSNIADNGFSRGYLDGWQIQNLVGYGQDNGAGSASGWRIESNGRDQALSSIIAVTPGESYYMEVWVYNTDSSRANIYSFGYADMTMASPVLSIVAFTDAKNVWTRLQGIYTIPSTVRALRMGLQTERTAGSGTSTFWSKPVMRRASGAELIVDGAITADKIAVNAVTAAKIAAGTITANEIASGTITGNRIATGTLTAALLAAGTITGDKISGTTIAGDRLIAGTITSTQIAANTITGDRINSATSLPATLTISGTGFSLGTINNALANATALDTYNGNFSAWAGSTPDGFSSWGSSGSVSKVTGMKSGNAVRIVANANGQNGLVQTGDGATGAGAYVLYQARWIIIEADITLNGGNLQGAGILVRGQSTGDMYLNFATDADTGGFVAGNGNVGQVYSYRKLIMTTSGGNTRPELYLMNHYGGIGSMATANDITWHNAGWRYASEAELNPAKQINAWSTQIDPGKILISGSTTLSNWRNAGDTTKIEGGSIAANTIMANKLYIGARNVQIQDVTFDTNRVNQVTWTAGTISWHDDNGNLAVTSIAAGSSNWSSGQTIYIWWNKGSTALNAGTSPNYANGNDMQLAQYKGGTNLVANYGKTIIDGTSIKTGTITADKISVSQLSAFTANIGTLRTASTGARTEISDNVIKVFDASNVLRVKLGNLDL